MVLPIGMIAHWVRNYAKTMDHPHDLVGNDYNEFCAVDPYNNNELQGYISRHSSDLYGALMITKVNGEKCPQLIYCTPKLQYPFDRSGHWHFPSAKRIERYEKLDGTNIFAYRYHDAKGNEFVSFKTRLLPFVGNSRFGHFKDMLDSLLTSALRTLPFTLKLNLSYELWGGRNAHLILYERPLALSLLFGRNGQKVVPPSAISASIETAPFKGIVDQDYVWQYQEAQRILEQSLSPVDENYLGCEGEVWYLLDESNTWSMLKCKPETIENIHFSAGGIGREVIRATCRNAFENWDIPTVEQVADLLKEEFAPHDVEKVYYSIKKHLAEELVAKQFRTAVLQDYQALGISILEDKRTVMRALSAKYKRDDMKRVYSTIMMEVAQ